MFCGGEKVNNKNYMDETKPRMLDPKMQRKLDLLLRYSLSYKRTYHALLWEMEENKILLRLGQCAKYNAWQLNEALYRYAESSISALYWLFPDKKWEDYPFVHKLLRKWRNINHHDERFDFSICEVSFL